MIGLVQDYQKSETVEIVCKYNSRSDIQKLVETWNTNYPDGMVVMDSPAWNEFQWTYMPFDLDDATDMTHFLDEVATSMQKDEKKTLEKLRITFEKRLAARPDADGKSMNELAILEIKEHVERMNKH